MGNGVRTLKPKKLRRGIVLLILTIVCLFLGKLFSDSQGSVYLVGSASMHPAYPKHTIVLIDRTPFSTLRVGDVIAFRSKAMGGRVALHRIVRAEDNGYYTKGDANRNEDNQLIDQEAYVGKCVIAVTLLARYLLLITKPIGFIFFFLLPLILVGALRLISLCNAPHGSARLTNQRNY